MREFASTSYRLEHAPRGQKWLYSICLVVLLLGLGSMFIFGATKTGLTYQTIVDYYRGNPDRMVFEKTFQELLEVAHMHLFIMPVVFLVLAHLFFLTSQPPALKGWIASLAAASILGMVLTPFAIRYWAPEWAWVKLISGYVFGASFTGLVALPLYDMWKPSRRRKHA